MAVLQTIVLVLFFLCCGVLVFLVMIQSGKGGSVGIFGGGGSNTAFGSSTMDVVTKATWYTAGAFFALALLAAVVFADSGPDIGSGASELQGGEAEFPGGPLDDAAGAEGAPAPGAGPGETAPLPDAAP